MELVIFYLRRRVRRAVKFGRAGVLAVSRMRGPRIQRRGAPPGGLNRLSIILVFTRTRSRLEDCSSC